MIHRTRKKMSMKATRMTPNRIPQLTELEGKGSGNIQMMMTTKKMMPTTNYQRRNKRKVPLKIVEVVEVALLVGVAEQEELVTTKKITITKEEAVVNAVAEATGAAREETENAGHLMTNHLFMMNHHLWTPMNLLIVFVNKSPSVK